MADIFDQIAGNGTGDIFDQISGPDLLPAHTPGAIVAPELRHQPDPKRNREVMGISTPAAREDVQNSIDIFDQVAKDVAGVVTKAGAGIVKGVTLGVVNPEKGTVGVPFTDIQTQVAPPLGESLQSVVGTSPEIANNPYIGMGPEVAGTAAPWGVISRGLSALTTTIRGAVAGKTVAAAAPVARTVAGEVADIGGRVAHQAATGAIVGAAENISPEESRTERVAMTAAMGAGGQIVAEGIRGIAMAAGAAKQAAYQSLVDDLGKWAYGEGHAKTPEAANTWAAQTVTEIIQDAGGLKNVTIRQARRAAAAVRNATKEAAPVEPVDVTPAGEAQPPAIRPAESLTPRVNNITAEGGIVAPTVSDIPVKDVFDTLPDFNPTAARPLPDTFIQPQGATANDLQPGEAPQVADAPRVQTISAPVAEMSQAQPIISPAPQTEPQAGVINQSEEISVQPPTAENPVQGKFERLANSEPGVVKLTPSERRSLEAARMDIEQGEAGYRYAHQTENGDWQGGKVPSTFPEYFKNKGYTKKESLNAIDKALNGKPLTQRQIALVQDLNDGIRTQAAAVIRAERRARIKEIMPLGEDNQSAMDFFDNIIKEMEHERSSQAANTGTVEGLADRGTDSNIEGTPRRTEAVDESGWRQEVGIEGDKKPLEFGSTQPKGRNVGLSEFMDGFTADPQQDLFSGGGSSHADTGGYDLSRKSSIELPEIVEIARELSSGKYPHVLRKLGRRGALGLFRPGHAGKIELRADLFKTPGLAERVLAHEIGHLADWLPDMTMSRGNILGRVASLKKYLKTLLEEYEGAPGVLTTKDRERIRKQAKEELKANERPEQTIIEEITSEVPQYKYVGVTPEMIKDLLGMEAREKYPKLYRAFSEMNAAEKKNVLVQAMKGLVDEQFKKFGERIFTGMETVTEQVSRTIPAVEASPEQIAKRYRELIEEEIAKRHLYKRDEISAELKKLTELWKPFNPGANAAYTKYRYSSPELYADAISVLLNDPDYLKLIAPTFEKAFFSYLQRKPELRDIYYDIQRRLKEPGAVGAKRVEEVYGMFERGHAKRNELAKKKPAGEKIADTIMRGLVDERHDALKIIRTLEKQGGSKGRRGRDARIALEELPYVSSEANEAIYTIQDRILAPAEAANISKDDLGALMFARRIVMEGGEKASALGHTAETAQRLLDDLRSQWGVDKFDTAQGLVDDFLQLRRDTTIKKAIDEKLFSPELVKAIEENTDYSTNSVQKHLDKDFGGAGNGITAQVYKRVGSLDEIENPFIATVMKDLSILRAVAVNKAKRTTVAALQEAGAAEPAQMKYDQNFKRMMPVDPDNPDLATIAYLVDGKPQFFYVAKPIAEGFKNDPVRAIAFARFIANLSQPFRELFVSKNPAWMARNVSRDFLTTVKNLPEVRLRDLLALANQYRKAWREVWREAHGKGRSDTIREMMEGKGLPGHRVWEARDQSFDDELDRIAASFDLNETAAKNSNRAKRALLKAWDWLDKTGRASDLWGKVAAYKFMQARGSRSPEEMLRMTRNRVGTPNIKRRGAWHVITNNLFMFSNVNKEGVRAGVESIKENPGAYAWKTFMLNILPRLVLFGAAAGYLGDRTKEILSRIPDYEKRQYNIIPLGLDENNKAIYLSIPQDYEGQFFGQLTWSLLNAQIFGKEGALNSLSNVNPYREHPMLQIAGSLAQYYLLDINPVDQFRGRQILSDDQAAAGGKYAAEGMGKYAWNTAGGSMLYKMTPDMPEAEATALEKALKTFPLTAAGAYLKVSDRGIPESMKKATEPVKRDEARERLIAKNVLKRMVEGEKIQLTDEEAQALAMHRDMVKNTVATMTLRRQNRHLLEAILRAGSKREKAAIIQSQEGK